MTETFEKIEHSPSWQKKFVRTKSGSIKENVLNNVTLIFNNDPLFVSKFRFNEFTRDNEIIDKMIIAGGTIKAGIIEDVAEDFIVEYIQRKYDFTVRPELVYRAFSMVCRLNPYNPATGYFDEAKSEWDGVKRVDTFLPEFLGAPKNKVTTIITKLFLTGTVAKAYNPESKFDFVIDLIGDQGTGKTTLLKKLGGKWYVDSIENFKDKDEYAKMLRALIVNDDEMKATNVSSFLPVRVSKANQTKNPVSDLSEKLIKQIWGEMVYYYKKDGVPYPNEEEQKLLADAREEFEYVDEVENQINIFLDNRIEEWVASSDIAEEGLLVENLATNRSLAQKIKNVMDHKDGWRSGRKGNKRVWWKN